MAKIYVGRDECFAKEHYTHVFVVSEGGLVMYALPEHKEYVGEMISTALRGVLEKEGCLYIRELVSLEGSWWNSRGKPSETLH